MTFRILLVVLVSVGMSAIAQIILKLGMSNPATLRALDEAASVWQSIWPLLTSVHVWAGLTMYGIGALVWLFVLAKLDVSMAYPFVGLGFILTMVMGSLFLGESVGFTRMLGTMLVVGGVYLVGRS